MSLNIFVPRIGEKQLRYEKLQSSNEKHCLETMLGRQQQSGAMNGTLLKRYFVWHVFECTPRKHVNVQCVVDLCNHETKLAFGLLWTFHVRNVVEHIEPVVVQPWTHAMHIATTQQHVPCSVSPSWPATYVYRIELPPRLAQMPALFHVLRDHETGLAHERSRHVPFSIDFLQ